jgi:hypothetical protein
MTPKKWPWMTLYYFDPEWPPKGPLRVIKKRGSFRVKRPFRVNIIKYPINLKVNHSRQHCAALGGGVLLHWGYTENVDTETDAKVTEKCENRELQFLNCYFSLSVAAGHGLVEKESSLFRHVDIFRIWSHLAVPGYKIKPVLPEMILFCSSRPDKQP